MFKQLPSHTTAYLILGEVAVEHQGMLRCVLLRYFHDKVGRGHDFGLWREKRGRSKHSRWSGELRRPDEEHTQTPDEEHTQTSA